MRRSPSISILIRVLDVFAATLGLIIMSPILVSVCFVVWAQDGHSPFYVASRVGIGGKKFQIVKLRSMLVNADKSGVVSTASDDSRITPIGHFIRKYKLDELTQLWNVLIGQMSLVGPRPNVIAETRLYTTEEQRLLMVRPGITDFSSIIFSDEGSILEGLEDPDIQYNQLIRPWKSRLSLFYVDNRSVFLALKLVTLTIFSVMYRSKALRSVSGTLQKMGAPAELVQIALREAPLVPHPPPGARNIVTSRNINECR